MTIDKEIEEFCKRTGITPAQFRGEEVVKDNLCINGNIKIPPGFRLKIIGQLHLPNVTTIPRDFAPVVSGCLWLDRVTTVHEGFAPVVSGYLTFDWLRTTGKNFTPVVGKFLQLPRVTTISDGFAPVVAKSLNLPVARTIHENFKPKIGENLYIFDVTTIGNNFAPVVGGEMYRSTTTVNLYGCPESDEIYEPKLFLPVAEPLGNEFGAKKLDPTRPLESHGGKYIIADGILAEVVSKNGNVWQVKSIVSGILYYLVTDGSGKFAHGDTLADARESLIYKISNRDTSKYKGLSKDSELSFEEAVEMYRTITGACVSGTQRFVKSHNIKKKRYTIKDIINMTIGQYGHNELVEFFKD